MQVYLDPWIVDDGQIPELTVPGELHDVAVHADCWALELCTEPEAGPVFPRRPCTLAPCAVDPFHVTLVGDVVDRRHVAAASGSSPTLLVRSGGWDVTADPVALKECDEGSVLYSPDFEGIEIGARVRVHCRLNVMADHEIDAWGFPGSRAGWSVSQAWAVPRGWHLGEEGMASTEDARPGRSLDRIQPGAVGPEDRYLLDLLPL